MRIIATGLLGIAFALVLGFSNAHYAEAQGFSQLDPWKATTTPYSAITTNIDGRNIYIPRSHATTSSLAAGTICLINDTCRTTWPGAGASFSTTSTDYWYSQNRDWSISGGYLQPTTTLTVRFPQGFISIGSSTIVGNATTTGAQSVGSLITTLNGERFTDLTGTGLTITSNALTLDATGDWTGTLDGIEGAALVQTSRALTIAGTANQITSSAGAQNLSADRTWTLSFPPHVIFPGSYFAPSGTTTNATSTNFTIINGGNLIHEGLTSALVTAGSGGAFAEYGGSNCGANTYTTSISALGVLTCGQVSLTAGVSGTLPVLNGGTGQTSFKQGWLGIDDSGAFISSTSPTLAWLTATSTSGTSVFSGILKVLTRFITVISSTYTPTTEGEIGVDSTDNSQLKYYAGGSVRTVSPIIFRSFSIATTTTWTGTTTRALGPAGSNETWLYIKCATDTGTLNVSINDGSNRMDMLNASTTVGTTTLSNNNSFVSSEKRYADIGTPASTPTEISCTAAITIDAI